MVDTSNMFRSLLFLTAYLLVYPANAQQRPVALELVLAVDTSTSVDTEEFDLQRGGLADAFAHPDLINVIEGMGETGIAVTMVEWAGDQQQATIVEWSLVNSATSALQVSSKIRSASRAFSGRPCYLANLFLLDTWRSNFNRLYSGAKTRLVNRLKR